MAVNDMCIHYNGIGHRENVACKAGVTYLDVATKSGVHEDGRAYPILTGMPCVRTDRHDADAIPCAKREWPSAEYLAERDREAQESFARMAQRIENRECIHCGAKVEQYREVRPCVYAEPCGHRQWQGRAPKEKATA